ncbi:GntR family transcriptional regulator [Planctomycetota bacterium]
MWKIDPKDPVPVYEQVANQLRYAVARGRYSAGDKLPSVRGLARETLLNPNTIVRVYRDLEHEGITRTEGGRGVFVTEEAPDVCRAATRAIVRRRIELALAEADRAGIPPEEVEATIHEVLAARQRDPKGAASG